MYPDTFSWFWKVNHYFWASLQPCRTPRSSPEEVLVIQQFFTLISRGPFGSHYSEIRFHIYFFSLDHITYQKTKFHVSSAQIDYNILPFSHLQLFICSSMFPTTEVKLIKFLFPGYPPSPLLTFLFSQETFNTFSLSSRMFSIHKAHLKQSLPLKLMP